MTLAKVIAACGLTLALISSTALADPLDPECTPEKAVKSAAAKAAVGVGGRCDPKEAASDTAKRAAGIDKDKKGPVEKRKSTSDTPKEKVKDVVK
jgi:hypothetical protein